jgi:hypothetical protein
MAQFRWAYVNCDDDSVSVGGPTGSVQFLDVDATLTGSESFVYRSSSAGDSTLFLTGTLFVSGTISASSFVVSQTDTISGSTIFGNDVSDTHQITGSLFVGDATTLNTFSVLPTVSQSVTFGMRHNYRTISTSGLTSSTGDYIIGIGGAGDVEFRLLSASLHGSGAILVIKDETTTRTGAITLSASSPNNIDNNGHYEITGTMPAISLYSNGSDWFVF